MQKLTTGYTMYFNKKNERTGALFQGKYKARHADNNEYLKYLVSYIHLNPVKLIEPKWKERGIADTSKAEKFLESYRYSSYTDFLKNKKRPENAILSKNVLPDYFESIGDFKATIKDWLSFKPE